MRRLPGGELTFFRPDGRAIAEAPTLPTVLGDPLGALAADLAARGVAVADEAALPSWDGTPLELAWAVDCLRAVGTGADA